ncbi:MAG TPA: aldo/keto reductase [Solirubrobacteraceae bacterium]|jgi:aryl-alcohol dehydrogenase-like predicted oxidoreductase
MPTRQIDGTEIFRIGLGAMPMSVEGRPDADRSIRTIHAALDAGANLIDLADAYALGEEDFGHNEALLARALGGSARRDGVIVATKGGHTRSGTDWTLNGRPEYLRAACEASLRRLNVDRIDLYQFHRPDPDVPFAESVGALRELRDEGKIRWAGLSNVTVAQLDEAEAIVEIAAVQNQLSLEYRGPIEKGEVAACADRGIAFLAWSPLGGIGNADEAPARVEAVRAAAEAHGVSVQQVALAWLLSLADTVVPIPGASRPETILDSLGAASLELTAEELQAIGAAG